MNIDELLREARSGDMAAQYELAEYYGRLLKETKNEDEIYNYSKQAMIWLKKSAKQGYKPAVDAVNELNRVSPKAGAPSSVSESGAPGAASEEPALKPPAAGGAKPAGKAFNSSDTLVMGPVSSAPRSETSPAPKAKPRPEPYFASTTHIVVVSMLVVSLLINIFLLWFLFKMVNSGENADGGGALSASPTAEPTPTHTLRPSATPRPSASPSPSPSPSPTPTSEVEESWLDLTKYPDLEVLPEEIYDDYEYYTVIARDSLNMRSGPDTTYEKIGSVPSGMKVGAVAQSGKWYLVYYDEDFGWVHGDYISNEPGAAPSPEQTPTAGDGSSGDLTT